jgi:deoxyuridine 5'-triphosphate nucleotidohydrolase
MEFRGRIIFIPMPGKEYLSRLYPAKETFSCAGVDFFNPEEVTIAPLERKAIATGFEVIMPEGMYGQIVDCSGNALQKGCHVLGGIIDTDYQGEMFILLCNLSRTEVVLEKHAKLAQMIIHQQPSITPMVMSRHIRQAISIQSARKSKGFGFNSTDELHSQATNEQCATIEPRAAPHRSGPTAEANHATDPGAAVSVQPHGGLKQETDCRD